MRKKVSFLLIVCILMSSLTLGGCKNRNKEGDYVLYLSTDGTSLVPVSCKLKEESDEEKVGELLDRLQSNPGKVDLMQVIPENVDVTFRMDSVYIGVDFSKEYYNIARNEEVLIRAAIVRTLLQINSVYYVFFTVEGEPLVDSMGNPVGNMSREFFVENPGKQINSSVETTLTLYFSNEDGTALVQEKRTVKHSTSMPMEKLIMQQLIAGAKEGGHLSTIPPTTQVFNVAVSDGVCFVNFDDAFKNQNMEITENVVLYSIVNSLTQMPTVKEVMISVNGDTSGCIRYNRKLAVVYTRDLSFLEEEPDDNRTTEGEEGSTEPVDETSSEEENDLNNKHMH